jgi:hypothetical protein
MISKHKIWIAYPLAANLIALVTPAKTAAIITRQIKAPSYSA